MDAAAARPSSAGERDVGAPGPGRVGRQHVLAEPGAERQAESIAEGQSRSPLPERRGGSSPDVLCASVFRIRVCVHDFALSFCSGCSLPGVVLVLCYIILSRPIACRTLPALVGVLDLDA